MDLYELENIIIQRRKTLGNMLFRLAFYTRDLTFKNFPKKADEAFPDLFPEKKGIPMPENLKEKVRKRGVNNE